MQKWLVRRDEQRLDPCLMAAGFNATEREREIAELRQQNARLVAALDTIAARADVDRGAGWARGQAISALQAIGKLPLDYPST
jgi:hypothetical protein